jgi:hypothetical protein
MNRGAVAVLAALAIAGAACSDITGTDSGVIALEIRVPTSTRVEVGDTIQLEAHALNQDGDSVAATVTWRASPDTVVDIDSTTGRLTGLLGGSTGQVQAMSGKLTSNLVTFTVLARVDTLVIRGPDTLRVAQGASFSPPLDAALQAGSPPLGVSGRTITYEVVQTFGQPGDTLQLNGAGPRVTVQTGADGGPATPVMVETIAGTGAPDSAYVEIRATRPSGALIPGSGQVFIVRFD